MTTERQGLLLCLVSAAGFGAMAIFAKDAYDAGLGVVTLLALRFVLASAVLWALAAACGAARLHRRTLLAGLALGALGYSAQSGAFFASLERIDASLASLLLYAYPAMVCAGAIALRRDRFSRRKGAALAVATLGVTFVLLGGGTGTPDPVGIALALAAAVAYSAYILATEDAARDADPLAFAAAVTTGAALTFAAAAAVGGGLDLGFEARGWLDLAGIALISTVVAVTAFLLGLARIGAGTASIASTFEPVVTVTLAVAVLGESLGPAQVAGGALVLAAVVLLQAPVARRRRAALASPSASSAR